MAFSYWECPISARGTIELRCCSVGSRRQLMYLARTYGGFTVPGLTDFLQRGGILKVDEVIGGNFYPFSPGFRGRWLGLLAATFGLVFLHSLGA